MTALDHSPLAQFYTQFGRYLRQQTHDASDDTLVPARVGKLYQSLTFNSVTNFIHACFPICRRLLGDEFDDLCKQFFDSYALHSPYFTDINRDFAHFLDTQCKQGTLPNVIGELAHYEHLELLVEVLPSLMPKCLVQQENRKIFLNATAHIMDYEFAVHHANIADDVEDIACELSFVVVYQKSDGGVYTLAINALTYTLLQFLMERDTPFVSVSALFETFLIGMGSVFDEKMRGFAEELLDFLTNEEILIDEYDDKAM
ncbi:DNA-binding domain-containing protein [Moraxella nasovis]|uniref:HvfC family RiPP maturation protein n=1 Tax=Moraxella nasovis TaxID=2904121 RepID=UPI001F60FC67|nr:putative DNA-binding domain-containing protein [Moraxella nasovis]UNU73990.1 DNA-binding domain-containing protein [Moraxella nasovis]